DTVAPDWNQQAAAKANEYLRNMSFSRQGLYDQLIFEKFTPEQADYAVAAVGF
ncbi:Ltp family lipoprotein, partial [Listeria monocytogenes]